MEKWKEKVAVVTGANSGCGYKICEELVKNGLKVVGLDIKDEGMKNLKTHSIICDITSEDSVKYAFS